MGRGLRGRARAASPTLEDLENIAGGDAFVLFFEPPSLDDRIVNQSAVLSTLSDGEASMDDWIETHSDLCHAWRIAPAAKTEIRERLDQANITERVLMPGLDGLATWLRRYYAPGRAPADLAEGGGAMAGDRPTGTTQGEQAEERARAG